jgi:leader peptidase (prepilin peptidase)/N-methyltransferase
MRLLEMLSRGDLGHADVVLSGYLGLFIGAVGSERLATALFVSFLIAGLVALVMIATKRATRTSHIPFGPFLFVGMVVAVLR